MLRFSYLNNLCVDDGGVSYANERKAHPWTCGAFNSNQRFKYNTETKQIMAAHKPNLCLDDGGATSWPVPSWQKVYLGTCAPDNVNQRFTYDPATRLMKAVEKNNMCLDSGGAVKAGETKLHLQPCDSNNINQLVHPVYGKIDT